MKRYVRPIVVWLSLSFWWNLPLTAAASGDVAAYVGTLGKAAP